jgi:hypothetical protein
MIVTFEGHSDDIVSWAYGASLAKLKRDEHYVQDAGPVPVSYAAFRVATIGGTRAVTVHAIYGSNGTWAFAYGQAAEGLSIPAGWAFIVERAHDYSTRLVIDTCDDIVEAAPTFPKRDRED